MPLLGAEAPAVPKEARPNITMTWIVAQSATLIVHKVYVAGSSVPPQLGGFRQFTVGFRQFTMVPVPSAMFFNFR